MSSRSRLNYPPKQRGFSCHHAAYPYAAYKGNLEHNLYQHNEAMLLPVRNERHNVGALALHSLIDPKYGVPPKPRHTLMLDAVDFMQSLDRSEPRIRRFGQVIGFFMDEAEWNHSPQTADQALQIADHFSMQYTVITLGGAEFIKQQQYRRPIGEAA